MILSEMNGESDENRAIPHEFSITGLRMIFHPNGKEMKYQLPPGLHF
jgi:hypothetical protein